MSTNLIEEVVNREAKRLRDEWGSLPSDGIPAVRRSVSMIVADVLDILTAEGRLAPAVEPGLCWHDSGITWPNDASPRCELRAGHAGAHECNRGSMGGTAVWDDAEVPQ